jgi:hypothetical protein
LAFLSTDSGTTLAASDDICTKRPQTRSDRAEERQQMPRLRACAYHGELPCKRRRRGDGERREDEERRRRVKGVAYM